MMTYTEYNRQVVHHGLRDLFLGNNYKTNEYKSRQLQ
jgi:hypothetical protein